MKMEVSGAPGCLRSGIKGVACIWSIVAPGLGWAGSAAPPVSAAGIQERDSDPNAQALENQKRYREAADEYDVYLTLEPAGTDTAEMRKYIKQLRRKK